MDEIAKRMTKHIEAQFLRGPTSTLAAKDASDDPFTLETAQEAMRTLEPNKPTPKTPRVVGSRYCADQELDFSKCRSPSRAARRFEQGIRGNVGVKQVPWEYGYMLPDGTIVMHPDKIRDRRIPQGGVGSEAAVVSKIEITEQRRLLWH